MKIKLNRFITFILLSLIIFVLAIPGSASSSLKGGETLIIKSNSAFIKAKAAIDQMQGSDLEAACSFLDDGDTRSMMSAMLETKLLYMCGRSAELGRRSERGTSASRSPVAIEAWTDTLVNYPSTDVGNSTTQSETSIRVNPTTGTICAAYNDSQHYAVGSIAFSGFSRSTDGGLTFTDRGPFPAGGGGISFGDPSLIWREADGYFYYASLHSNGLGIWRSTDDCQNFSYLSMIHTGGNDDKELMEVDNNPASTYYGRIYVAWTDIAAGARIYSTYSDDGTTWSTPLAISGVGVDVQGAWPTVAPNGDVYVAWVRWNPYPTGPIDIEVVRSTNGGVSFSSVTNPMTGGVNPRDATASSFTNCNRPALHANAGDGIRYLPSPQIAAGPDGCLHVVYVRDPDGYNTGDVINVYYRSSCDNGATWSPELQLNDDATLTDQYFPTVSVGPGNIVVATWYDRRNDPGNNYMIDYYKAYSQDGGVTWGPNIRVSDVSTPIPQLKPNFDLAVASCYYGDYDQQVQDEAYVYMLWSDSRNVQNAHPDPDIWFEKELMYATGTLTGTVYDDSSLAPIADALVRAENPLIGFEDFADQNGDYTMEVLSGTYDVTAMAYGYDPSTVNGVVVLSDSVTTQDLYLIAKDFHNVEGTVTDATTGWPLYAAIYISGYPSGPVFTDPVTGYYSVSLSEDVAYVFNVMALPPGYDLESRPVGPLTGNSVEDFALNANLIACMAPGYEPIYAYLEDFETGYVDWTLSGLWNAENEGDTCGSLVAPFPSPSNDAYYGDDTTCDYDTGGVNAGELTMVSPVSLPLSGDVALRFMSYEETECDGDCGYDNRYVEVSTDGGGTWDTLGEGNFEGAWYNRLFDLSPYLGQDVLIRFRFDSLDGGFNNYFGWMVDDIGIQTDCQPIPGGLVVGYVQDANTNGGLAGAVVTNDSGEMIYAVPTPLDPNLEDGFYSIFSPAGTHTFTATIGAPYGDDVDDVGVVLNDTVSHNFELPAGWLSSQPYALDVPVLLGTDLTVPLTLTNLGGVDAGFEILELDRGFNPGVTQHVAGGTINWNYRNGEGVIVELSDSGSKVAYPGSYQYVPDVPTIQPNVLVYTDDWIHTTPNTLVQQAITMLGIPAAVYVDGDYPGFETALTTGGPWDLVIWSGENFAVPSTTLQELLNYVQGGGKLAATYWSQQTIPADPLWAEMGFQYISNYVVPPPAYWWDPGHSVFNYPESAPEWINRVQNSINSQGTNLEPLANGLAVVGYTTTPMPNEAGMVIREDGFTVYKGMRDVSTDADDDMDAVLDGIELWENIITGLLGGFPEDIPWLFEDPITGTLAATSDWVVDVTLDATAPVITQTGQYLADLLVLNDTPYGNHVVPVTMTVVDTVIADVDLLSDMAQTGDTGTSVIYTLEVINLGNLIDSFDVSISGNNWSTTAPAQVMNFYPGQSKTFDVMVMVPMSAVNDAMDIAAITVISQNDPLVSASVSLTTTAKGSQVFLPITFKE